MVGQLLLAKRAEINEQDTDTVTDLHRINTIVSVHCQMQTLHVRLCT